MIQTSAYCIWLFPKSSNSPSLQWRIGCPIEYINIRDRMNGVPLGICFITSIHPSSVHCGRVPNHTPYLLCRPHTIFIFSPLWVHGLDTNLLQYNEGFHKYTRFSALFSDSIKQKTSQLHSMAP